MRSIRLLSAGWLLCLWASCARADGLHLNWDECAEGNGPSLKTSACSSPLFFETLVSSFELSAPVDSVIGMEVVIDLVSDSATLPNWWRFEPGGCNAGALVASADFSNLGACANPWNSTASGLVQAYRVGDPRGASNTARIVFTVFVLPSQQVSMTALTPYYAGILRLAHTRSAGANACAGCSARACLVLNSVQLLRQPGSLVEQVQVVASGGTGHWAAWQGSSADCNLVPVRNRTWGAIKSSYR